MKKVLYCLMLFVMCGVHSAWAFNADNHATTAERSAWGATSVDGANVSGGGDFIREGGLGKTKLGSYFDEYAIVGIVATQIVQHGGLFCPKQIQCTNQRKKDYSYMHFYDLNGFSNDKCLWLCEYGYTGVNCGEQIAVTPPMKTDMDAFFSGVSMRTSGDRLDDVSHGIETFFHGGDSYGRERAVLLGLTDFVEHGAYAMPVYLSCKEEGYKDNISYMNEMKVYPNVKPKLLCAEGYMPNSTNTACELLTQAAIELRTSINNSNMSFCSTWDETKYDPSIHQIDTAGTCIKFLCRDSTKAFPGAGDYSCVSCANGVRGGQHKETGVCVVCDQPGQYFDQETNTCKEAAAYSMLQLKYGTDGKENKNIKNDCWTKVDPDEYKNCVTGKDSNPTTD